MIEFDVLPEDHLAPETSRLLLAHDYAHAAPLTLEQGLAHLAGARFARRRARRRPQAARATSGAWSRRCARHGLVERTLVSTLYMRSLVVLRELEPRLRLGWSVPRVSRDYTASPLTLAAGLRAAPAARGGGCRRSPRAHVRAGRCDALMAHWRLVTPRLVRGAARRRRRPLRVDRRRPRRRSGALEALGVTGVITNDPRLFDAELGDLARRGAEVGAARRRPCPGGPPRSYACASARPRACRAATRTGPAPRSTCAPPVAGGLNSNVQPASCSPRPPDRHPDPARVGQRPALERAASARRASGTGRGSACTCASCAPARAIDAADPHLVGVLERVADVDGRPRRPARSRAAGARGGRSAPRAARTAMSSTRRMCALNSRDAPAVADIARL